MFNLHWVSPSDIKFTVYGPPDQEVYINIFKQGLIAQKIKFEDVVLLTSSLFFSMLPLHQEDPDRQVALAIMGMILKDMHDHACSYSSSRSRFSI